MGLSRYNDRILMHDRVVGGMDVLTEIESVETDKNDKPKV